MHVFIELGRVAVGRRRVVARFRTGRTEDLSRICLAQLCRRIYKRSEDCRQIERRAADDLEDVSSGGLLPKRLAQLVEQARAFSIAITAWAAKFVTDWICSSVNGRTS